MSKKDQTQNRPGADTARVEPTRRHRIAVAAYLNAERRGFVAGGEIEDWLEAEREIDSLQETSHDETSRDQVQQSAPLLDEVKAELARPEQTPTPRRVGKTAAKTAAKKPAKTGKTAGKTAAKTAAKTAEKTAAKPAATRPRRPEARARQSIRRSLAK
jgi:hypothetical protein